MALDQNLFTLQLSRPSPESGCNIDLVDPSSGSIYYRKRRLEGSHSFGLYDSLSDSLLSAVSSSSNNKAKVIELFNPNAVIQLKYTGTLSFRWSFPWEDHTFEWKREQCFLIRKPDPPVLVAITKEPPGKIRSTLVQILDYNLMRFDIMDRKGLEILMLTALLSFQDDDLPPNPIPQPSFATLTDSQKPNTTSAAPKPSEKTTDDEMAILQASESREANEVVVGEIGDASKYAELCLKLLKDQNIVYIAIRSSTSASVPKVVTVAELTKRLVHRDELFSEDLHQYLAYQEEGMIDGARGGKKKVIRLDGDAEDKRRYKQDTYKPPENLIVWMSKIPMPELIPKAKSSSSVPSSPSTIKSSSSSGFFGRRRKDDKAEIYTEQLAPPPNLPARPASTGPVLNSSPHTPSFTSFLGNPTLHTPTSRPRR